LLKPEQKQGKKFASWRLQHNVPRGLLEKHLSEKPCLLLLDELNAVFDLAAQLKKRDEEVYRSGVEHFYAFLKNEFTLPAGRLYVFSTHIFTTSVEIARVEQLLSGTGAERQVSVHPLPLLERWEDAEAVGATTRAEVAYFGRSPGLLVSRKVENTEPARFVRDAEGAPQSADGWKSWLKELLQIVREGTRPRDDSLLGWQKFFDVDRNQTVAIAPVFLSEMLKQCEGAGVNDADVHELALALDRLRSANEGDGKAWEAVIAAALGLRLLGLSVGVPWSRLQPCPDIKNLAPSNLQSFGGVIRLYGETFSKEELREEMKKRVQNGPNTFRGRIGFLVLPVKARFAKYDLFIGSCTPDLKKIETWGYQCKEGDQNPPLKNFPVDVQHAVWLRGKQKYQSQHDSSIVPPDDKIAELLGHSLASAAPFNWFHRSS